MSKYSHEAYQKRKAKDPEKWRAQQRAIYDRSKERDPYKFRDANRRWRAKNPEKFKASWKKYYEKNREKLIESSAKYARDRKEVDPEYAERVRDAQLRWLRSPRGKARMKFLKSQPEYIEKQKKANKNWSSRNKDRIIAYGKVDYAIKKGDLKRLPCERCGSVKSEAIHNDLLKPLDVFWRCRLHHPRRDKK